jgi:hypothetical protein
MFMQSSISLPLPQFHSFGVSSSLHQSPIWIKASLMSLSVALSRCAGPENLRLLAVSKKVITDHVVVSQPQGGSRHGQ